MTNEERISFVCYPTFLDAVEKMPKELQGEAALAILKLGINGEWTDSNPYIDMMLTLIAPNIKAAKGRYTAAVENGKKGGRPSKVDKDKVKQLFLEGKTNTDIAAECGCTADYIRKLTNTYKLQKNQNKLGFSGYNLDIDIDIDNNNNKDNNKNSNREMDNSPSANEREDVKNQLLELGFEEDWIEIAFGSKPQQVWDRYGYGLLFKHDYQLEINELQKNLEFFYDVDNDGQCPNS